MRAIPCVLGLILALAVPARAADILPPKVEWQARTIWHPTKSDSKHLYFRKVIELPADVQKVFFAGSCDDAFELFVNGVKVGQANRWNFIDFYRLGVFVHPGKNVIAVHCINPIGSGLFGGQVDAVTTGGKRLSFGTDGSWRLGEGEETGWAGADFDDSKWLAPKVGGPFPASGPWGGKISQPEQPDLAYAKAEVAPAAVLSSSAGGGVLENVQGILKKDGPPVKVAPGKEGAPPEFVVDFGRMVIGYPVVEFMKVPRGALIEIAYGQSLRECLQEPNQGIQRVDLLTLDPGDVGRWVNPIVKGYRYVRFIFRRCDEPVELNGLSNLMFCYSGPMLGALRTNDDTLNRTWDICTYAVRLTMQRDHYSDDIKRERTLWMGDMYPEAMTNYYAFRDYDLLKKCLPQLAGGGQVNSFLDYQCWWGLTLADYYLYSGDEAFLRSQEKNLDRCIAALQAHQTQDGDLAGLLVRPKDSPDWCMNSRRGYVCMLQCLWAELLTRSAELKRAMGDEVKAAEWEALAKTVREKTARIFWDEQEGAFADFLLDGKLSKHYPQDGNAFAVVYGVASPEQAKKVSAFFARRLHDKAGSRTVYPGYTDPKAPGIATFISPYMTQFEAQAHFVAGDDKAALDCIRLTWGHMLSKDATTTWESYGLDGEIPRPGISLCHGWSGGAAWVMERCVAGVRPTKPGFAAFEVRPQLGDLREASGTVPTPQGQIKVSHALGRNGAKYEGSVEFTGASVGEVWVPESGGAGKVIVNGKTVWENSAPTEAGKAYAPAIDGGRVRLTLSQAGLYTIRCEG